MTRMTRVPEPTREQLSPDGQAVFDRIVATRGGVRGPFSVLLHSPALAERVAALGEHLRFRSGLDGADRELAILTAGRETEAAYEWAAHEPIARREGTRPGAIAVVRERRPTDELLPREAVIVETVRALHREHRLTDVQYARAESMLGRQALLELIILAGYYGMIALVLNAFDVDLPPGTTPPFSRPCS